MGKEGKPAGGAGNGGKVVTDNRFAAVHYDPRFQRFPKSKAKVEIDERFAGGCPEPAAAATVAAACWIGNTTWLHNLWVLSSLGPLCWRLR